MFGKQEIDDYEVFAKLIGKPHTEKTHQLLTIRRDGCINPSAVWAHPQPGKTPGFHQMTWMLAERLFLLSLLTATSYKGLETGWEVNFESRMIQTCCKTKYTIQ